eukprot:1371533-Amorphochlora_amoeboformis.AAC.3
MVRAVKAALDAKADPNEKDLSGQTVLSLAITLGFTQIARLLLEYKADANAADEGGWTPLLDAANKPNSH